MVRGSLNRASRPARNASSSSVSAGPVSAPAAGSTTALISSPQSWCGMAGQLGLDLGRVDIDPARDDHVAAAVTEEQVAVLIQVTDVPHGEHLVGPRRVGLLLVLVIRE